VLLLFGLALVVIVVGLGRIADAERALNRLDHAKHAGHQAANLAREQYIHQAHTLLEWNLSHMDHYDEVAVEARRANGRSVRPCRSSGGQADRRPGRRERSPLPRGGAPGHRRRPARSAAGAHAVTEAPVQKVVALNEALNRSLEAEADVAQRRAE